MAAVDVEVRTVPDETGELRADGLASGGALLELLEHATATTTVAINITVLGRIRPPWLLGLAADLGGPTLQTEPEVCQLPKLRANAYLQAWELR